MSRSTSQKVEVVVPKPKSRPPSSRKALKDPMAGADPELTQKLDEARGKVGPEQLAIGRQSASATSVAVCESE